MDTSGDTGALVWKYAFNGNVASSPAIGSDGTIYFGAFDGNLYAVNPDGSLRWKFAANSPIYTSPAIAANGTIYFGSDDDNFYAIH